MDTVKAAGILGTVKEGEFDDYFSVDMVSEKVKRIMPLIVAPSTGAYNGIIEEILKL